MEKAQFTLQSEAKDRRLIGRYRPLIATTGVRVQAHHELIGFLAGNSSGRILPAGAVNTHDPQLEPNLPCAVGSLLHCARVSQRSSALPDAGSRASVEGYDPMMEFTTRVGNRLLAALPPADLALLAPYLRKAPLEHDAVLVRSGDRIEHLLFPCSGAVAFIMDLPNGQTVATAVVGNEGAIGLMSALGPSRSPMTAVVRVPGSALQISPARFQAALNRSPAIATMVQILTRSLLTQFQHVAACNALHSVEARLARWLLHFHDRSDGGNLLPLTQETLSELLGVRRTTVTHVVRALRASRAIRSNRRGQLEIDRPRLEAVACECYKVMSRRIDRIVSHDAARLRHAASTRDDCQPPDCSLVKPGS